MMSYLGHNSFTHSFRKSGKHLRETKTNTKTLNDRLKHRLKHRLKNTIGVKA
jgi:hypothetical protein